MHNYACIITVFHQCSASKISSQRAYAHKSKDLTFIRSGRSHSPALSCVSRQPKLPKRSSSMLQLADATLCLKLCLPRCQRHTQVAKCSHHSEGPFCFSFKSSFLKLRKNKLWLLPSWPIPHQFKLMQQLALPWLNLLSNTPPYTSLILAAA